MDAVLGLFRWFFRRIEPVAVCRLCGGSPATVRLVTDTNADPICWTCVRGKIKGME